MTLLESAKKHRITPEIREAAILEKRSNDFILDNIAKGQIVIPKNNLKKIKKICAIGTGLRTKVNANIGTSPEHTNIRKEIDKLKTAVFYGADTVMDLSIGGNVIKTLVEIIRHASVPVGTVPIYQAALEAARDKKSIVQMTARDLLKVIQLQAKMGVDFMTIHAGVTMETIQRLQKQGRMLDIVSRGGSFLLEWMAYNQEENPLFRYFDQVLDIAYKYDITLSLGDGLRPGSIIDTTDRAQVQELIILGELAKKSKDRGVQVIIEGPGHLPISDIEANVILEKKLCNNAPFYVLGPLITDVALGYDHITAAIGGAIAAMHGADFLCYVTPSEHLRLPNIEDVRLGVIASRIAAHAADIAKNIPGSIEWDIKVSRARKKRSWQQQFKLSMDKNRAKEYRKQSKPQHSDVCTMCGDYCSMKIVEKNLKAMVSLN